MEWLILLLLGGAAIAAGTKEGQGTAPAAPGGAPGSAPGAEPGGMTTRSLFSSEDDEGSVMRGQGVPAMPPLPELPLPGLPMAPPSAMPALPMLPPPESALPPPYTLPAPTPTTPLPQPLPGLPMPGEQTCPAGYTLQTRTSSEGDTTTRCIPLAPSALNTPPPDCGPGATPYWNGKFWTCRRIPGWRAPVAKPECPAGTYAVQQRNGTWRCVRAPTPKQPRAPRPARFKVVPSSELYKRPGPVDMSVVYWGKR
jgi:hypothetical protein